MKKANGTGKKAKKNVKSKMQNVIAKGQTKWQCEKQKPEGKFNGGKAKGKGKRKMAEDKRQRQKGNAK